MACLRRGTLNEVEADTGDLCDVHRWQAEAAGLSPDYYESWWRGQEGRDGKIYGRMPKVLRHSFVLSECEACGITILPWRRRAVRKAGDTPELRWCTPSEYRRKKTCSTDCAAQLANRRAKAGDGPWVGMGEIRQGRH